MDQVYFLKKMTGEERLEQAFKLSDLTRELVLENIKIELGPEATKKQILSRLKERIWLR